MKTITKFLNFARTAIILLIGFVLSIAFLSQFETSIEIYNGGMLEEVIITSMVDSNFKDCG